VLCSQPQVLIMDEPSRAYPMIVQQVEELLIRLAREEDWRFCCGAESEWPQRWPGVWR
jgi:ABC-type polar amino acid transport system ATPase subunit